MRGKLGDKVRLQHVYDAILEIESYIVNKDFSDFMDNSMIRFACIKQMEIIGEACNHITDETKENFTTVEWSQIVGMRNVFVHDYFGVDVSLVWDIIKNDLPDLKEKIKDIIDKME